MVCLAAAKKLPLEHMNSLINHSLSSPLQCPSQANRGGFGHWCGDHTPSSPSQPSLLHCLGYRMKAEAAPWERSFDMLFSFCSPRGTNSRCRPMFSSGWLLLPSLPWYRFFFWYDVTYVVWVGLFRLCSRFARMVGWMIMQQQQMNAVVCIVLLYRYITFWYTKMKNRIWFCLGRNVVSLWDEMGFYSKQCGAYFWHFNNYDYGRISAERRPWRVV